MDNKFFECIEQNIADEAEARAGYYAFLAEFGNLLTSIEKDDIREIIAEELKHSEMLARIITRRNHIYAED